MEILHAVDRLLASHPDYSLSRWVDFARRSANKPVLADRYEANAKRLITTWGGWQEDYAARFWAGLVEDYYIPRIQKYFSSDREGLDQWEEEWINTPYDNKENAFDNPLESILQMLETVK